jgi:hypothetical protein
MKKREPDKESWETPSLEWIHQVRRQRQAERAGRQPRPLASETSEKLARQYGLKVVKKVQVG